ncbi:MAG: ATP-binding cassette domain-containing protein [Victivallaceae bacterium]|nr:ATP-binding cassette domain-containing protein [Victivallaceae bacterium]
METPEKVIEVTGLAVGYGGRAILEDMNFEVRRGEIFGILGGSGCGKSTLLKHLIGLYRPLSGDIRIFGEALNGSGGKARRNLMRRFGVTYQGGALFGSMTLLENVMLPLEEFTALSAAERAEKAMAKLGMVGLTDFADYLPAEISGGMTKRAGLARALVLDPELLFFDEPSAGLDPITSAGLDKLILNLRDQSRAAIVMVTHELESIFSIVDRVIVLDRGTRGIIETGDPRVMRSHSGNDFVREFLNRDGMTREHYEYHGEKE